jgi:subtilisin family serine protease
MLDTPISHEGELRTTGRKLVVLRPGVTRAAVASALADTELELVVASDFGGAVPAESMAKADAILLDKINVMVVAGPSATAATVVSALDAEGQVLSVEQEGYVFALGAPVLSPAQREYLEGYLAGVQVLVGHLVAGEAAPGAEEAPGRVRETIGARKPARTPLEETTREPRSRAPGGGATSDETLLTWGLQAVGVEHSPLTGRGIRVAVLDTGIDFTHPDVRERRIVSRSFVPGVEVQDRNGHGTHTSGTAAGPQRPSQLPRYGVGEEATLYIGKVLGNDGSGQDGWILNGINWALENGCRVISMSLGAQRPPVRAYQEAGQRALDQGAIIVAAAGNESDRKEGIITPTGAPANAETILAVAALNEDLTVANFSCGGKIDIAAPGVNVLSSYPSPRYRRLNGTSMATPHVAGVVALLMQADPSASAQQIWDRLKAMAKRLDAPASDIGSGLAQAPSVREAPLPGPSTGGRGAPAPTSPSTEIAKGAPPPARAPILGDAGEKGPQIEMGPSDVIVVVKSELLSQLDRIVDELKTAGMHVEKIQRKIGTVTGSAPASQLEKIRMVEGVATVEKAGIYRLPPPESDTQ